MNKGQLLGKLISRGVVQTEQLCDHPYFIQGEKRSFKEMLRKHTWQLLLSDKGRREREREPEYLK